MLRRAVVPGLSVVSKPLTFFLPSQLPVGFEFVIGSLAGQVRWKRGRRKKKPRKITQDHKVVAPKKAVTRLEDLVFNPETPYKMRLTINQHLRGLADDGRYNVRRKKDLSRYTHYRMLRIAGLTHDNPKEDVDRRGFVTPLTDLQDSSTLPRSLNHRRFHFPHTLDYKVYWGPPSVYSEPNEYEGSMVGCTIVMRMDDLPLTARQKARLIDVVGEERYDEETGVVALEADFFSEQNHNAAILGDMVEALLAEVMSAEESPPVVGVRDI